MGDSNKKMALMNSADRIGDLPDSILHHILSFLDMKQVVEMSLVSTRWRNLWVSVPILNFNHSLWKRIREIKSWKGNRSFKDEFINFVDKVLFHRDHTSNVTKFKLSCDSYYDTDRLVAWMALAATKQFQEMHVDLWAYKSRKPVLRELSEAIFNSGVTVFVFNFMKSCGENVFQMPKSLSLSPHLKTLVLQSVELPQGNSNGELVLSCPVLEHLELVSCEHPHLNVLIISTLQLKSLVIVNSNPEELESCEVKIFTPNLENVKLRGVSYKSFSLGSLPFLVNAKIENYYNPLKPQSLVQLLESISCAATVELHGHFQRRNLDISDMMIVPFSNLRCLTLAENDYPATRIMLKLLKNTPCIETLVLKEYVELWCEDLYDFNYDNVKSLEIGKFNGRKHEIPFLKFLLKNAVVLEKLTIRMGLFPGRFVKRIYSIVEAASSRIVLTVCR